MTIKVAIAGARGRMGTAAVQAIMESKDMEVVAALDYKYEGIIYHKTKVNEDASGIPFYTSFRPTWQLIQNQMSFLI